MPRRARASFRGKPTLHRPDHPRSAVQDRKKAARPHERLLLQGRPRKTHSGRHRYEVTPRRVAVQGRDRDVTGRKLRLRLALLRPVERNSRGPGHGFRSHRPRALLVENFEQEGDEGEAVLEAGRRAEGGDGRRGEGGAAREGGSRRGGNNGSGGVKKWLKCFETLKCCSLVICFMFKVYNTLILTLCVIFLQGLIYKLLKVLVIRHK